MRWEAHHSRESINAPPSSAHPMRASKVTLNANRRIRKARATPPSVAHIDRSHAAALIVIHKWLKPVIPAWTAGIQSQGGESAGWCVA